MPIQHSLYGVDLDPGAVEIAKLRLWLSMVVDEDNITDIQPLPNLDYKIMQGNSLLEEFDGVRLLDDKLLQPPAASRESEIADLKKPPSAWPHRNLSGCMAKVKERRRQAGHRAEISGSKSSLLVWCIPMKPSRTAKVNSISKPVGRA